MAKLTVKLLSGEEFEIENVNLNELTPSQLINEINEMIDVGGLLIETIGPYVTVGKCREFDEIVKIVENDDMCLPFSQLGFEDGDIIIIIPIPSAGGGSSINYPENSSSLFTYGPMPHIDSLEEWTQQFSREKIAISKLEELSREEQKCRSNIEKIRFKIKEQNQFGTCKMLKIEPIPFEDILYAQVRTDTAKKMHDLLITRLEQLNHSSSFIGRFRKDRELKLINELLELINSLENERVEMMRQIEVLLHEKMDGIVERIRYNGFESNRDEFLESFLFDHERELGDLINRRRREERELALSRIEIEMDKVYSSTFAPAEVNPASHLQIQVYIHLLEETEKIKALAQESDKNAERRDYIPLQCKLRKGDMVGLQLNIYGETLLLSDKKSVVWQGSFTKCSFDYFVPKDINVDELSCMALLTVNGIPVGEMRFITRIVNAPRQLNTEVIAHKYNKVFISYSHQDEAKVKFLHEGLEVGAVPHFFDRNYLKAGDVFPQVIKDYINSADLFILCWSENASKSEYVQKERLQALKLAFPQVKPEQDAKLRIYPMSIEPRTELPRDMKENYHFGEI